MEPIWHHTVTHVGNLCTVAMAGEVDMSVHEDVARVLVDEIHRPGVGAVQVDLDAVDFLDSSGMLALLTAHKAAGELDRGFTVVRARRHVRRALDVAGLLPILSSGSAPVATAADRPAG